MNLSAYISVPRDLTKVKSKIFFNLTKRIGVPAYFLLRKTGNMSFAAMCMILIMLPFFFLAMYERDGMPLEVILQHFIEAKFVRPKDRPYQTDNYYAALQRMAEAEQEVNAIVLHAEAKKRKGSRKAARQPQQK